MKKQFLQFLTILSIFTLASCQGIPGGPRGPEQPEDDEDEELNYDDVGEDFDEEDFTGEETNADFSISTKVTDGYKLQDNVYTISKTGEYTLSGKFDGQIVVDVGESETDVDNEVTLTLKGVSLTCSTNSPIYVKSADKVKIKSQKDTYNEVHDERAAKVDDVEGQGEGAIYAKSDLNFTGKGTLVVYGKYNNGVHTTKDLKIKSSTIKSSAVNNAFKGNNSITISESSTNVLAVSAGGDGLKTEDSDISSSGNQKGSINIKGGTVNIFAACDGIDASYDINVSNGIDEDTGETTIPVVNIYTNKYSSYTDDDMTPPTSINYMYLRMSSRVYNSGKYSFGLCYSDGTTDTWKTAKYETSQSSGRSTYYFYKVNKPDDAVQFKIYAYTNADSIGSYENYYACSQNYEIINSNYDTVTLGDVNGSTKAITLSDQNTWSNYNSNSGGGGPGGGPGGGGWNEGNSDKADGSAKGLKAANDINISGGKLFAKTYDDGIHANYGDTLENGSKGSGNVNISGGYVEIEASDDGIHADRYLTISGGTVKVNESYEGLEGAAVVVTGGSSTVIAKDDGVNASGKNNVTALVNVTGGYLDVTVPSNGDTDGIDSNGKYTQSGGIVITRGPSSNVASSLDIDDRSTADLTGGTLVCLGKPAASMKYSSTTITYSTVSGTVGVGDHTLTVGEVSFTFNNKYSHSGCYCYSDQKGNVSLS